MDGKQTKSGPRIPTGGPDPVPPPLEQLPEPPSPSPPAGVPAIQEPHLLELLREVIDPELSVDIVGLGLVREARTDDRTVHVAFTVTMPACPMQDHLENEIRSCLLKLPEIDEIVVRLVNEPAWSAADMSEEVRTTLGWTP